MTVIEDQARSLFLAALERGPDQWPAFLDEACGGHAGVRARVEELLCAHQAMGSIHAGRGGGPAATVDLALVERPGTVVGPYKLLEQIGEGGFGVVFLAEQTQPVRRKVALKVLKAGMDTRQVVARFEAERQALALMDHPHIAKVFDGGATASGRPYFVMELVKGVPITDFCDQNHLTPRQRLELFLPVCRAVQHAHQKGIIHRDLKPSNVLVSRHDTTPVVKVIDFGVAKALGQELTDKTLFTGVAQMVGTPLYMSPEQAGMSDLDVDTRGDIYSLGVVLYELLTGTTPFTRERFKEATYDEIRRIIREEEPPRPSTRLSTLGLAATTMSANRGTELRELSTLVRGDLDWIVMKALEKDRTRRYETASTFAADIQRYLADEPVLACPPSPGYRFRKFARRNKGTVLAASLVVLALLAGIVGTTWGMFRADAARVDAANEAEQKRQALADARDKLFQALVNRARAERSSGRVGQRFAALKAIREAAQFRVTPELRTEAMAALVLPDAEVVHEWEAWPEDTIGMAFDAFFERYVRLDRRGGITLCRRTNGREEILARLPAQGTPPFSGPYMSPDGRYVAFRDHPVLGSTRAGKAYVWTLQGPAPAGPLVLPVGWHLWAVAYRPDRRQLAIGHVDGWVGVYDLDSGERVRRLELGISPRHLAFHPKDGRLAVAAGNAVRLFDVDTEKELPALRHTASGAVTESVCWHPDGRRLATGCTDLRIHIWDTQTASEVMTPWVVGFDGNMVAFHPDGDLLVSRGFDTTTRVWDAATGRLLLSAPGLGGLFSQDGRLLGYGVEGNRVRLWRLAAGRELRALRRRNAEGPEGLSAPILYPDGRRLAASSGANWLSFFDAVSGEELASVRLPGEYAAGPVFFDAPSGPPASGRPDWKAGLPEEEKTGGWITGGHSGVLVWPARLDPARPSVLRVGPPRLLIADAGGGDSSGASASEDGRIMAVPQGDSTVVLHRDQPGRRMILDPQYDVRFSAVSPDGRWVVTGSHWWDGRSKSARIWDAETGRQVHELPVKGSTRARFSPDGQWLLTLTGSDTRLWEVGAWREVRRLTGSGGTFSPDSRLLAIRDGSSEIRLEETTTGREVARLTGPEQGGYLPTCFTPDGTRLFAQSGSFIYVWNLRLIRRQLKELGLNWHWPEFPPAAPGSESPQPLQVEVLQGDLHKPPFTREQRAQRAIEYYRRQLDANPNDAKACENLAWVYLTAPEGLRDEKAAVPLAEKAVQLAPKNPVAANALGLAYYRARRYREAVAVLRANLENQEDSCLGFDLYFLAMSHQELGEAARARDYFDLAVRWTRTHRGRSAEDAEDLAVIHAEAGQRLGLTEGEGTRK
jgi:serine/threonine protein kinase/WD40 repeat protein